MPVHIPAKGLRYRRGMHDTSPQLPADDTPHSIYLIAAHPRWRDSRVNRRMLAAAATLPGVTLLDLYGRYPDYTIDVAAEQARVAAARMVVLMHPIQWYAMPPLQKLWVDEVLTWGWAYGPKGEALHGKDFWLVATTGGGQDVVSTGGAGQGPSDVFLPPYVQTAALCGMRFMPPLLMHGVHTATEAAVTAHVARFVQQLKTYPHWPAQAPASHTHALPAG